ncbi:hypothetical protein HOC80_04675 [archaeon]|jgi:hypothetical protein|nr:hypothetical protein [archaeon]MBT4417368.1 hypothetical protein [archaeon]
MSINTATEQRVRNAVERTDKATELFKRSFLHHERSKTLKWPKEMTNNGLLDVIDEMIVAIAQGEDIKTDGTIQFMYPQTGKLSNIASRHIYNDHEEKITELRAEVERRDSQAEQHCSVGFHTDLVNGRIQTEYTRPDYDKGELIPIAANLGGGVVETITMGTPLLATVGFLGTVPYTAFSGYRHFRRDSVKSVGVYVHLANQMYNPEQLETLQKIHKELVEIAPQQKI